MTLTRNKSKRRLVRKSGTAYSHPEGVPHPTDAAVLLVPSGSQHPVLPRLNAAMVVPDTWYQYNLDEHAVTSLVTKIDGAFIAWFNCRRCSRHISTCECHVGVTSPRSIEYLYDKARAQNASEEWSVHHPNYGGSLTKAVREKTANRPMGLPPAPATQRRSVTPTKALTRHKPVDVDMRKVDKAADSMSRDLTKKVAASLGVKKSKSLARTKKNNTLKRK